MGGSLRAAVVACVVLAACGPGPSAQPTASSDLSAGEFTAQGGSAALNVVQSLVKAYTQTHPRASFDVKAVSSEESVVAVSVGDADLGFISRDLKSEERGKVGLLRIGITGTAVAVNSANGVTKLTKQQVADIYTGKVTDWKDVGGTPGEIRVFLREGTSSTRATFEGYFFDGKAPAYSKQAIEVVESDETIRALTNFKGSIGMVTLAQKALSDKNLRLVTVDGIPATLESLQNDVWPIRRPTYLIFANDAAKLKPGIKMFLDWVRGPEGQKVLASF